MDAVFTGFDSAWGAGNSGAICDLLLLRGDLRIVAEPQVASWDYAIAKAGQTSIPALHVWAIDQPLVVCNDIGCRPVESDLTSALMGAFGCGAYPANRANRAWMVGAPIWKLTKTLERNGFLQSPMAVPGATEGRFFFECYPHPALLGLFNLSRILKYKVHHKNLTAWQTLISHMQSLASAELPITNVEAFVRADLAHTKINEDKLDSIVAAYVAAYWWKFGTQRSTMIGGLDTGYIVTPHSAPTLAAFERVFGDKLNPIEEVKHMPGVIATNAAQQLKSNVSSQPPEDMRKRGGESAYDWVYFSTSAKLSGLATRSFAMAHKLIVRSIHNKNENLIANVRNFKPGDRILLVHGGGGDSYRTLLSATVATSKEPVETRTDRFEAFTCVSSDLEGKVAAGGYPVDTVVGKFTAIAIDDIVDLWDSGWEVMRPIGNNAIWRWADVR